MTRHAVQAVLALSLLFVPALLSAAEAPKPPGLDVRVVDKATGQPVAGAKLEIMLTGRRFEQQTDAGGTSHVALRVQDPAWLGITISKDGYVSKRVDWRGYRLAQRVPPSQLFELERGITIGGVVHDTAGKPLSGVELSLGIFGFGKAGEVKDHLDGRTVITGPDGRWSCDGTPPDISTLNINFMRPQTLAYSATGAGLPTGESVGPAAKETLEPFKQRTAVLVRPDVLRVPGTVLGPDGKPVAGADVSSYGQKGQQLTGVDGTFVVDVPASTVFGFMVTAPGFAPERVRLEKMTPDNRQPVAVRLRKGETARGRIVDTAGKPIEGAIIDYETPTDADGRFTIADLPEGAPAVSVQAEGFLSLSQQPLRTGGDENVITLRRPTRVTGSVVDAETGKPIPSFKVVPGTQRSAGQPMYISRDMAATFSDGKFDFNFHDPLYAFVVDARVLRVEADGYVPAVSPFIPAGKEAFSHEFKLARGEGQSGVVLGVDRKPLAGVKVWVSTPGEMVYVNDGSVHEAAPYLSVTTDAEGRLIIPPQGGPFAAVVLNESGIIIKSDAELKHNPELRLMPWGRVEGVVKVDGKPAAGETVEIDYRNAIYPDKATVGIQNTPATTSPDGRYVFERVGPVQAKVGRVLRPDPNAGARLRRPTHQQPVDVKPGEIATVNFGGGDAAGGANVALVGRIKPPAELAERGSAITYGDLSELRLVLPPLPVPENFNAMTMEEKAKWGQAYLRTPEGKKIDRNSIKRGRFPVTVRADGSFSVDDLGPGTYSLSVRGLDTSKKTNNSLGEEVVKGETMFVIPENFSGKRFDVGELTLESLFNLSVGKDVPDPELKTLDGKPLKLSDFRGKVILLDFWATWCGPCVGDTPNLKAVHEAFGKDERFVLISLSLDPHAQPAIDYVKKNELGWVHGFLGDWGKTKVPEQFGVRGIPAYFLIGPDGKLTSKEVNGNTMKREVEAALAKVPRTVEQDVQDGAPGTRHGGNPRRAPPCPPDRRLRFRRPVRRPRRASVCETASGGRSVGGSSGIPRQTGARTSARLLTRPPLVRTMPAMLKLAAFADEIGPELDDQIRVCRDNDVTHFELRGVRGLNVLDFPSDLRNEIHAKLRDNGMGVASIGSPIGKVKIDEPWDKHFDRFKIAVELAQFFAAPFIRIFSYYPPQGGDIKQHRDEVVRRMNAKLDHIEKIDVTLVHENEADIYGEHGRECMDLMKAVNRPKLRSAFDFANFVIAGERPRDNWPLLKPYTTHIHVKDAVLGPVMKIVPPGQGDGDIASIVADAYASGYRGFLTMEPHLKVAGHSHGETGPELFKVAVDALKGILRGANIPLGRG